MLVRLITHAIHQLAAFVYCSRLADVVPVPLEVSVKVGDAPGDQLSVGVVPGALSDSVPCVYCWLAPSG